MRGPLGAQGAGSASRFGGLIAGVLACGLGLSSTARAALVTEIAENPDPNKTFAVDLDLQYQYLQEDATIQRQFTNNNTGQSYLADELAYKQATHVMDLAAHFGLFKGFELHVDLPYVIQDNENWQYAKVNGKSVQSTSTIQNNDLNADGAVIGPTPLFSVPGSVNRGGFSDPTFGFTIRVMDDRRPVELPGDWYPSQTRWATWVIGLDYTPPIVPVMNPSVTTPGVANSPMLPVGLGEHQLNFWTAISKRYDHVEPFLKIHYDLALAGSNAYNNCSISAADNPQNLYMSSEQANECSTAAGADSYWIGKTGLQPPMIGGILAGTDFHAVDTGRGGVGLDFSLQFSADYVSKGRYDTEISDELHKLTYADEYFNFQGQLTADFRFARIVHWITYFSLGTNTPHTLTDESVGNDRTGSGKVELAPGNMPGNYPDSEVNPDYSFSVDQPGRQFAIASVMLVGFSTQIRVDF